LHKLQFKFPLEMCSDEFSLKHALV